MADIDRLQTQLDIFLNKQGRGSAKRAAAAIGVSEATMSRFRSGQLREESAQRLSGAISDYLQRKYGEQMDREIAQGISDGRYQSIRLISTGKGIMLPKSDARFQALMQRFPNAAVFTVWYCDDPEKVHLSRGGK
jgi:hypothetical protein